MAHPDSEAQRTDVQTVLASLGLEEGSGPAAGRGLEQDRPSLDAEARDALLAEAARRDDAIPVSALTGEGIEITDRPGQREAARE